MASNTANSKQVTVILGDEFDDALRAKLLDVLRQLNATALGPAKRDLAGSQEIEELEVNIDGKTLRVEAETYVGLSISGPDDLVQRVRALVSQ